MSHLSFAVHQLKQNQQKLLDIVGSWQQQPEMPTEQQRLSAQKVKPSADSSASDGHCNTDNQVHKAKSKMAADGKRAMRCVDCGKKFDGWRTLQRHKRKHCPKSLWRFLCRECKAFFPSKTELSKHISTAHVSGKLHTSRNGSGKNNHQNKSQSTSDEGTVILVKDSKGAHSLKRKKVHKCRKNVKKQKSGHKNVKLVGKVRKSATAAKSVELRKAVVETCTVGSTPFSFTTSCAPDAESFQFLCQSCLTVRFATYAELRQHEDWCARVRIGQGFLCLPCGCQYRNLGTLRRHAEEYHRIPVPLEVTKVVANPFRFSTTIARDAASFPHVCASCLLVCFQSPVDLRKHEDWCGQCTAAKDGFLCNKCGRYFRTADLLERHTAAAVCTTTDSTTSPTDDGRSGGDVEPETVDGDIKQKTAPDTTGHSVCPLCDVLFITQYEQQVHFRNIHNLTSSELKIKKSTERHSRRGLVGTQVTCLDCDIKLPSRLELVQHKRVCTKEKKYTEVIVPVTPRVRAQGNHRSNGKNICSVGDGNSATKDDILKAGQETASSAKSIGHCENQDDGKLVSSTAVDAAAGTQRLPLSQGLLLNTTKVRNLIRRTGARQLVLQPDGGLLLLGDGGQKISTINGNTMIRRVPAGDKHHGKAHSNQPGSSEKPNPIIVLDDDDDDDAEKVPGSSKALDFSRETGKDKCTSSGNPKYAAEKSEENSAKTDDPLQPRSSKVVRAVEERRQIRQHPDKSLKSASVSASASKTRRDVGKLRTLTRKRSLHSEVVDLDKSASDHEKVKTSLAVEDSGSRSRRTRRKRSPDSMQHPVTEAADPQAPTSKTRIKVSDVESSSESGNNGQQTLLQALQLVPVSTEPNRPQTISARYRTRSSTHASAIAGDSRGNVMKKSRYTDNGSDTSRSQKGGLRSSTKPGSGSNTTRRVNKSANKGRRSAGSESALQQTRTVEPVSDSLVRCVACRTIFRTVRQIVDHICAGQ